MYRNTPPALPCLPVSPLCLFGIGHLLEDSLQGVITALGRTPDFLCDNAPHKWGKTFWGIPCISPDELARKAPDIAVVITIKNYGPVIEQLSQMGITSPLVACFDRGYNYLRSIKTPVELSNSCAPAPVLNLAGRRALITGASRGIGREIALALAKLGTDLILHARCAGNLKSIAQLCQDQDVEVELIAGDLGKPTELEKLISNAKLDSAPIDLLFNNAGISTPTAPSPWSAKYADYLESFNVNTYAPIRLCQAIIPGMMHRGFGRIINISSSIKNRFSETPYACSKAALDKYVFDMAPLLEASGVAMCLVDPGWIRTDMGGKDAPCTPESVLPGAILGATLSWSVNGRWFTAQDYSGLSLTQAAEKAYAIMNGPNFESPYA